MQPAWQMRLDGRRLERLFGREQQRLDDAFAELAARAIPTVVEYWTGIPVVFALLGDALGVLCAPRST